MNYESEIKTFVKRTSRDKEIIAIYLFGSYPENFSNRSDIDICIIGKLKDSEKRKIIRDSPELFDISFFDELPVFIKVRIFKRGRELFVRDRKIIEDIKMNILKEYRDFMFFMKGRMAEIFENV